VGIELALVVSGASGGRLAVAFARAALACPGLDRLHVVVTPPAEQVLAHELGPEWAPAERFVERLGGGDRAVAWANSDLMAPIASGSHRLGGVIILPCSAGMAGSLAHGISRGLGQRVADVALKQRWPLVIGIREAPMSVILLENLLTLARAGAFVVPPVPAFYADPGASGLERFVAHHCLRLLDLVGLEGPEEEGLRWRP